MTLELVRTSKRQFGSDIPQGNIGQSRYGTPSNHIPIQAVFDRGRPGLGLKVCLGQDFKSNRHWVRHCGTRLGPMAQRARGPVPYKGLRLWAVPQGRGSKPIGLGDLVPYSYIAIFSTTKYKFMVTLVEPKLNNLALQLQCTATQNGCALQLIIFLKILLNCVFTLFYIKYIILFTYLHCFVVNILYYYSGYIILLCCLYYFIVLKVKIKLLILGVL